MLLTQWRECVGLPEEAINNGFGSGSWIRVSFAHIQTIMRITILYPLKTP